MRDGSDEPEDRLSRRARVALAVARDIEDAVARGEPADRRLSAHFRSHREYGSRDRRLYGDLAFSLLRWRGWTGTLAAGGPAAAVFAHLLDHAEPWPEVCALAAGIGVEVRAGIDLTAGTLPERAARFAAAAGRPAPPAPEDLAPGWFADLFAGPEEGSGASRLPGLLESFQRRPPLWLRASRGREARVLAALAEMDAGAASGPLPGSVRVDGHPHIDALSARVGPCFEVQDLASQEVGHFCGARPGERWWDVCAGSGGKALHLAEITGTAGHILATDRRESIGREFRRRVRRRGEGAVEFLRHDATHPLPATAPFDGVLVDAPCSGAGTWSRSPDARWRMTAEMVGRLAEVQRALLRNAAGHVRPGGRLVYSVCTFTRPETTEAVAALLASRPDFALEAGPRWVLPEDGASGGMFMARLRRAED